MIIFTFICISLHTANGSFSLLSSCKLNDISHEEMAWDKRIEDGTQNYVLTPVVMAANAYEYAILPKNS